MGQKQPKLPEFEDRRIALEKQLLEREAKLASGPAKLEVERRIRQLDTAARVHDWLSSPGLRPPT
jgi:hypothetical protein